MKITFLISRPIIAFFVAASVFLSPFPGHCASDTKKLSRFPTLPRHHITFNSGNVFLEYRDLPWFGQGKGLQWIRSYNSQEPVLSILGYGWTFTGNDCLTFEGTLPTYNRADGRIYKFLSVNNFIENYVTY